jgi:hypothetical protein
MRFNMVSFQTHILLELLMNCNFLLYCYYNSRRLFGQPLYFGPPCKNRTHIHRVEADCIIRYTKGGVAEPLGLEPRRTESKSVMLPLHHSSTVKTWWRMRESNSHEDLAKVPGSHYINPPN